jgi:hypothetical protein
MKQHDSKYFGHQLVPNETKNDEKPGPLKRLWTGSNAIASHIPRQGSPSNPYLAGAEIMVDKKAGDEGDAKQEEDVEDFETEGIE